MLVNFFITPILFVYSIDFIISSGWSGVSLQSPDPIVMCVMPIVPHTHTHTLKI